jgi:DNA-binding MarR family transcriptional regulator
MTRDLSLRARVDTQTAARLRLVVARLVRSVRQHGTTQLTPSQVSALSTIEDFGPIRMSDLATRECVGAPVATRVVASLQELGYVQRGEDQTDRRACFVRLTSQGRRILKQMAGERTAGLNVQIEKLSKADLALLQAALPVLEALARDNRD